VVLGLRDPVWGECVVAALVLREPTADAVIHEWCEQHLAAFKRPVRLVRLDPAAIPRTATGKVQKGVLRDRLLQPQEAATP
jgi:fatty-acyl-CoA synthase